MFEKRRGAWFTVQEGFCLFDFGPSPVRSATDYFRIQRGFRAILSRWIWLASDDRYLPDLNNERAHRQFKVLL
jgi:hypothetical protein